MSLPRRSPVAFVGLLLTLASVAPALAEQAKARLETAGGQTILHLHGSPYDMGKARGSLLKDRVRQDIDALLADQGDESTAAAKQTLATLPEAYRQEMKGLAEGSGVALERIELAQAAAFSSSGAEAALFGKRTVGGKLLHWSHVDRATDSLIVVYRPEKGAAYAAVTSPGLVGCWAGMNDQGISASVQHVAPAGSGLPIGIAVRETLRQATSLGNATTIITELELAGAANLLVADGKIPDARIVEIEGKRSSQFGPGDTAENVAPHAALPEFVRRSNHFVAADATKNAPDSRQLYAAMTKLVEGASSPIGAIDWIHGARKVYGDSGMAVLFSPSDLSFWLQSPAAENSEPAFQRFELGGLLANRPASEGLLVDTPLRPLDPKLERLSSGTARPGPRPQDATMPAIYRLDSQAFNYEVEPEKTVAGVLRSKVRFPSPVTTEYPENNTVHAELFCPFGTAKNSDLPCVIVLHITGGDFELSRFIATTLAKSGTAALFVKMPYYGERRPPGGKVRMVSNDLERGLTSMRQVVLDLRRACDWIDAYPGLDGRRIGVMGVSLGSITGALASAIEPRITHACLVMGGAQMEHILYESTEREARQYLTEWTKNGGTREKFAQIMAPYDPATYGERLKQRVVLMISASEDKTIPHASGLALWEATGRQRIVWYPCGHYTMAKYFLGAMGHTIKFFQEWPANSDPMISGDGAAATGELQDRQASAND